MRKSNLSQVKFNFSYEKLYQLGVQIISSMERDIEEFAKYGITEELLNEFRTLNQEFVTSDYDNQLLANQMYKTEQKNIKAEEIRSELYSIMLKIRVHEEKTSITYLQFDNEEIYNFSDYVLASQFRKSIAIIKDALDLFSNYGFTEELLDNYSLLLEDFIMSIDEQNVAINLRDISTQERHLKANRVYDLLAKYSYIGRTMWRNDEARSNDYVIYKTKSIKDVSEPDDSGGSNQEGNNDLPNG